MTGVGRSPSCVTPVGTESVPTDSDDGDPRRWALLSFVLLGQFMVVGSLGSMNLALPHIENEFDASASQLQWIVVIEQLAYAVVLIPGGRLGDVYGRRRLYMLGLAGFTVASLLAGLASSPTLVIAARLLQGTAGGLSSPQVLAMIRVSFGPRQRPKAYAAFAMVSGGGFMAGQIGAGVLITTDLFGLGWRLPFIVTAIGTVVAVVGAAVSMGDPGRGPRGYVDTPGALLAGAAALLLLFPIIQGREAGWPPAYLISIVASMLLAWWFLRRQGRLTRSGRALVDLRLFHARTFRVGLGIAVLFSLSAFAPYFVLTYTLQSGLGLDALQTALYTAGGPIAMVPASFLSGRFVAALGPKVFLLGGALNLASCVAIVAVLHRLDGDPHPYWLLPAMSLQGFGQGICLPAIVMITMRDVAAEHAGAASGVYQMIQQLVGAIGMAVYSALFFGRLGGATSVDAYVDAFTAMLPLTAAVAVGFLLSYRLIPRRALDRAGTAAIAAAD